MRLRKNFAKPERFVVEKFHFHSKHFDKQLTVELHFTLEALGAFGNARRPATAPALAKGVPRKVTVRLDNPHCRSLPSGIARRSKSVLLLPDFASEVYGFLDRAHVGTSLIANRSLNNLIFKLRNRLPVHHLVCDFEPHYEGRSCVRCISGEYWITVHHIRSDLPYTDSRRFKVPSEAGPAAYCSLVLRYLSNSHVYDFKTPESDFRFSVKMLAALEDRNFSARTLRLGAGGDRLTDNRSMDAVFGRGMRLDTLELSLLEHELTSLIKTTDFFRMPTIQKLKTLKLDLEETWQTANAPRRLAIVSTPLWISGSTPLWIAGIHLLHNAERFEVNYNSDRHLETIGHKMVQLCEKFERGETSELVHHFKFATSRYTALPFKDVNKTASKMKVGDYDWDVYRFRNSATGDWLTGCVGQKRSEYLHRSVLHIVRGDAFPDFSYAD